MATKKRVNGTRPAANLYQLGQSIKKAREKKGVLQSTIAALCSTTAPNVSKYENGHRKCSRSFIRKVDEFLDAGGELIEQWNNLEKDGLQVPDWFDWKDIEPEATVITHYQLAVFCGLAQTENYAMAILKDADLVAARMARQKIIHRKDPKAPVLIFLVDELALIRPVGSPQIMAEQLQHLIDLGELPNVKVQVVESDGEHRGNGSSFILATLSDGTEAAYTETSIRGLTTDKPADIESVHMTLIELRAKALPEKMSREFIRKVIDERWT